MNKELPIYKNTEFEVWPDKVSQLPYKATIVSDLKNNIWIESNLLEEYNSNYVLNFKLSINGFDNELPFYQHHSIILQQVVCQKVKIIFGQINNNQNFGNAKLGLPQEIHIIGDLSHLFQDNNLNVGSKSNKSFGYIGLSNNFRLNITQKIDLYLAGQEPLLSWDFSTLRSKPKFRFNNVAGNVHQYELRLNILDLLPKKRICLEHPKPGKPMLKHRLPLANALFRLAIKETEQNLNAQKEFRAGKNWEGVWTRDLAYSVILGLSHLFPNETENSLIAKIKNNKAVQDTGTGGAWPCSSDRILWVVAAWQHYLATGSESWLQKSYSCSIQTLQASEAIVYDYKTGLFKGETSFLDWREQSYPAWCSPAQIAQSISLSTNLAHLAAYQAASQMAMLLGVDTESQKLQEKQNKLLQNIQIYFPNLEQYSYGTPFPALVNAHDGLALALGMITEAEAAQVSKKASEYNTKTLHLLHFGPYGFPCFWPQIPHIAPYHNHAVWPFVQSLIALGAAKMQNMQGLAIVEYTAARLWRAAALFGSNKENLDAQTGQASHTLLNSDAQLWSTTGMCSLFLQVFAGLRLQTDYFCFQPMLPQSFASESDMVLENITLRNSKINISVQGFGILKSLWFDGQQIENQISYKWLENQKTDIHFTLVLSNINYDNSKIFEPYISDVHMRLNTPAPVRKGNMLCWQPVQDAESYEIRINGQIESQTRDFIYFANATSAAQFIQTRAISRLRESSFWSQHVVFCPPNCFLTKNISSDCNEKIRFLFDIHNAGIWLVYFVFANGNGPINTGDTCAIRTLSCDLIDNKTKIILPHTAGWHSFEHAAPLEIELGLGTHEFVLYQALEDQNMNGEINNAFIKSVELYKI